MSPLELQAPPAAPHGVSRYRTTVLANFIRGYDKYARR